MRKKLKNVRIRNARALKDFFEVLKKFKSIRNLKTEHDKVMKVLWDADLVADEQGKEFLRLVPKMHRHRDARRYLNSYGHLCEAYCREIIRLGVSEEIELAFIHDNSPQSMFDLNTLWTLHKQGHNFSAKAHKEMKKCCPESYRYMFPNK